MDDMGTIHSCVSSFFGMALHEQEPSVCRHILHKQHGIKFTWIFPNSDKMLYQNCKHFTILTYLEAPSCAHLKDIATRELPHKFRRHGVQHTVGHLKKKTRRWKYWRWIWRSLDIRCGMPLMFHAWNMYLLYEHILNDSLIPYDTCSKK